MLPTERETYVALGVSRGVVRESGELLDGRGARGQPTDAELHPQTDTVARCRRARAAGRAGRRVSESVSEVWRSAFGVPRPQKIVCVGRNYGAHAGEEGEEPPVSPLLFAKFANTIIGPGTSIELPEGIGHVDAEAELAVVIGASARRCSPAQALNVVAGYTVANDVSAREAQSADGQWFRAKGYDTFCPILPGFVAQREIGDGRGLRVTQRLNGVLMQDASTDDSSSTYPRWSRTARASARWSPAI